MAEETKATMEALDDELGASDSPPVKRKIELEETTRKPFDWARALKASQDMERIRAKRSGRWSGAEEIRRWPQARS